MYDEGGLLSPEAFVVIANSIARAREPDRVLCGGLRPAVPSSLRASPPLEVAGSRKGAYPSIEDIAEFGFVWPTWAQE
jgi:hypothetical protein